MALQKKYFSNLNGHEDWLLNTKPVVARRARYLPCFVRKNVLTGDVQNQVLEYFRIGIEIPNGFQFYHNQTDAMNEAVAPHRVAMTTPLVLEVCVDIRKVARAGNRYRTIVGFQLPSDDIIYCLKKMPGGNWMAERNPYSRES